MKTLIIKQIILSLNHNNHKNLNHKGLRRYSSSHNNRGEEIEEEFDMEKEDMEKKQKKEMGKEKTYQQVFLAKRNEERTYYVLKDYADNNPDIMQSFGPLESVSNLSVEHFNANNVFLEANKIWSIFERSLDGYSFYRYNIYMCALYNRALQLGLHNVGKISIQEVKKNWLQYYIEFKEDLFEQLLYGKLQYSIKIIDCLPQDFLKEVKEMDIKKRPSKSSLLVLKIPKNTDNNAPNVLSAKVSHTPDIKIQQILGLSIYKLSEKEVNIYANHSWNILETQIGMSIKIIIYTILNFYLNYIDDQKH